MLSLYAFLLSVLNDKLQVTSKTKTKKRPTGGKENGPQLISEKERSQMVHELMRQLKHKFEACDASIREFVFHILS